MRAVYRRDPEDPRFWLVHIAEEDRCHTFGRTLEEARENILDAASAWFDREVSPDEIEEDVVSPDP